MGTNDSEEVVDEKGRDKTRGSNETDRSITPIDATSIHKICSGQVILNLGTALKELLENSVDAGATSVEIRLRGFGADAIEVCDNGSGVEPRNFAGLGLKHHTSKLKEFSDLSNMETFGFRGEALSSLCSLGRLTVHTRHESCDVGSKLYFDSLGTLERTEPCPRGVGTTVTVSNIFHSLPVRHREFLKNVKKEYAKMIGILQGYSLILTGVRVSLSNMSEKSNGGNKQLVFSTSGNPTLKENIVNVFGIKQFQKLSELKQIGPSEAVKADFSLGDVADEDIDFEMDGFVSSVEHGKGRSSADRQFFFINRRPCDSQKVFRLINEVYRIYNRHQIPFVALRVRAKRETIDVNVTPDKRQMFMEKEKLFLATLKTSLIKLFETQVNLYDANVLVHCSAKLGIPTDKPIYFPDYDDVREAKESSVTTDSRRLPSVTHSQTSLQRFAFSKTLTEPVAGNAIRLSAGPKAIEEAETPLARLKRGVEERKRVKEREEAERLEEGCSSPPRKSIRLNVDETLQGVKEESSPSKNDSLSFFTPERSSVSHRVVPVLESSSNDYVLDRPNQNAPARPEKVMSFDVESIRRKIAVAASSPAGQTCRHSAFRAKIDPTANADAEAELQREISKEEFLKMRIVGQFNLGFIVVQLGQDLFIIDQHATDEKYNFETLQRDTVIKSQKLIVPQRLDLTPANEIILEENLDVFTKNGFQFSIDEEAMGGQRVRLISMPMSKDWNFGPADVEEMLFMLSETTAGTLVRPTRVRKMFASRACRKSIMIGTALNQSEMRRVVDHMSTLDQPWHCPHGRPTMRHLINLAILPD